MSRFSCLILCCVACDSTGAVEVPEKMRRHALPETAQLQDQDGRDNGVRFVDLNGDGYEDIVLSNAREYGVFLFVPKT